MRKLVRLGAAGAVLAAVLAGCEDKGLQEGQVPWKDSNVEQLSGMKDQMTKNIQSQAAQSPQAPAPAAQPANAPAAAAQPANAPAAAAQPANAAQPK